MGIYATDVQPQHLIGAHNFVWLDLPEYAEAKKMGLMETDWLTSVLNCLVDAFDPTWGFVRPLHWTSEELRPFAIGLLTYLPWAPDSLPELPSPARIFPNRAGSLVSVLLDGYDPEDLRHLALAQQIANSLLSAGKIKPTDEYSNFHQLII